jgi:hypothetical protein
VRRATRNLRSDPMPGACATGAPDTAGLVLALSDGEPRVSRLMWTRLRATIDVGRECRRGAISPFLDRTNGRRSRAGRHVDGEIFHSPCLIDRQHDERRQGSDVDPGDTCDARVPWPALSVATS